MKEILRHTLCLVVLSLTLAVPAVAQTPTTFSIHAAPGGLGTNSGEPSIGVNWNSDQLMYIAGLQTLRVGFDDCTSPAASAWTNVSAPNTSITSLDPILFTDSITGRTFASQLAAKCSNMSFTDDDGATWTPSQGCGINAGVDHQTVGGGPFAPDPVIGPTTAYPHAVYYCSQDVAVAQCALSLDGGLTFGPAVPIYNVTECGGLHGHLRVAPDGTVYVPNKNCGGENAVAVSEDNGVTWEVRRVPGTSSGTWDPQVGIATSDPGKGTIYLGMVSNRRPFVAVSHDKGRTWQHLQNVGLGVGPTGGNILNTAFPVMVAGDGDRAAFGFLGAEQGGNGGAENPSSGHVWYPYVAVTYDGGVSWETINLTPDDPVQRGTVCSGGTSCTSTRNLLDFNDMSVDREGRIVFGYADGCIGSCVSGGANSGSELATVARQVSGRRLFSAFDSVGAPAAPRVAAAFDDNDGTLVHVTWEAPDDRGSAITGYNVYRRFEGEASPSLIASVGAATFAHDDVIDPAGPQPFYGVTAVNGIGEGASCREISPGGAGNPCFEPGILVLEDPPGDNLNGVPEHDVHSLSIAEPEGLGADRIVFTLKMASMANPTPNTTWPVVFVDHTGGNRFVKMATDALGNVSFAHGTGTNPSAAGIPADPASSFSADGTIRIVVARSALGNPAPGQSFSAFLTRIRQELGPAGALTPDNMPDSLAGAGEYTIFGSENCQVSDGPIARDDSAMTDQDVPVVIDVVGNDTSFNGALTVTAVTSPANGAVANNGDGTVTYQPDPGFFGTDSFDYTIEDQGGLSDSATVTVTVKRKNTGPDPCVVPGIEVVTDPLGDTNGTIDATDDPSLDLASVSFAEPFLGPGEEKLVVTIAVEDLANPHPSAAWRAFWTSPDGQTYFVSMESCDATVGLQCSYGTFDGTLFSSQGNTEGCELDPDGTITITVDKALVGISDATDDGELLIGVTGRTQVFFGALCTGLLGQADDAGPGEYEIFSNGDCANSPPVASDDSAVTQQDTAVTIDVLANDSDPDGDPISVISVAQPANGSAFNNNDGTVTYTPDAGFSGFDSFEYTISDGDLTDNATVTVEVFHVDPVVIAEDDSAETDEDTPVTIDVLANDTSSDGDPLTVTSVSQPANGTAIDNGDGTITYTPAANFFGTDSFTYEACNPSGLCDTATVTITVLEVNDAPVAADDSATTQEPNPVTVNVVANDSDVDGDSLTVSSVAQPANGTATNNGDGTVTYAPNPGFTGTDSFTYSIDDGRGGSASARVTLTVTGDTTGCRSEIDDSDPAIEYRLGWHRRNHAEASSGGHHRRMGSNKGGNASTPTARVVFDGEEVTYFYSKSDNGGVANVFIDGALVDVVSYGANLPGKENPTFGHSVTYAGLGAGSHELLIEHRTGAVYIDGFGFDCATGSGADAAAVGFRSETETHQASAAEGPMVERTVAVGSLDEAISVVVDGGLAPLTVELFDPNGDLVATGESLLDGSAVSGLDSVVPGPGTYRIRVANPGGVFDIITISTARTVRVP